MLPSKCRYGRRIMKIQFTHLFSLALSTLLLRSVESQSTAAGSFTLVEPMKQYRKLQTGALLPNGKVLVAGGRPFAQAATSELYDPMTQTWTNSGVLNTGREYHTMTRLLDGRVVVTGG